MKDKHFVVCQHDWILTPTLSEEMANLERNRLSTWFSDLVTVDVNFMENKKTLLGQGNHVSHQA